MCFKSKSGRRIHIISWGNGWFSILFRVKQLLNSVIAFDIGDFPWLCFNYQRAKVQFLSVIAPHDLVDVREETPTVKILQLLDPCWTFCEIVSTTRALQVAQMFCHSVTPSRRCPSGKWMAGKVSGQWLEMYIFGVFSKLVNPPGKPNGIPLICGSTFGEWYVDNPQFVSVLQILYLISHRGIDSSGEATAPGFLTRMLCSETCGCSDPGGVFVHVQGCPYGRNRPCQSSAKFKAAVQSATCEEKSAEELRQFGPWISC